MRVAKQSKNLVSLKSNHKQEWAHFLLKGKKDILYKRGKKEKMLVNTSIWKVLSRL